MPNRQPLNAAIDEGIDEHTDAVKIMQGPMWHRRERPTVHAFNYKLWFLWLDVDQVNAPQKLSGWWRRFRPFTFNQRDYGPVQADGKSKSHSQSLSSRIKNEASKLGLDWRGGRVFILCQPRILGLQFNPLVMYWHFPEGASDPDSAVAEVSNTPWHQRHWYALKPDSDLTGEWQINHDKAFHVSPFMDIKQQYHWRLSVTDDGVKVIINNHDAEGKIFTAGMQLHSNALSAVSGWQLFSRFGLQAITVFGGIYAHAFRLWRKGVPFYSHPEKASAVKESVK